MANESVDLFDIFKGLNLSPDMLKKRILLPERSLVVALLLFVSVTLSCDSDQIDGKWDDNIKLSQKELTFSADSGSQIVTTRGKSWWIHGIGLNDNWDYDLDDVDTTQENFTIEEPEFVVDRIDATEIRISMSENLSGQQRVLIIGLQAGNYFDSIEVVQDVK